MAGALTGEVGALLGLGSDLAEELVRTVGHGAQEDVDRLARVLVMNETLEASFCLGVFEAEGQLRAIDFAAFVRVSAIVDGDLAGRFDALHREPEVVSAGDGSVLGRKLDLEEGAVVERREVGAIITIGAVVRDSAVGPVKSPVVTVNCNGSVGPFGIRVVRRICFPRVGRIAVSRHSVSRHGSRSSLITSREHHRGEDRQKHPSRHWQPPLSRCPLRGSN